MSDYSPQTWHDQPQTDTPISAARLTHIEQGLTVHVHPGDQPHDGDLDAIAALDSTTPGALVTDGAGWIRKTYAQLKTALNLVKGDVGLGNLDNTSDANKPVSTAQQTAVTAAVATATGRAAAFALVFGG